MKEETKAEDKLADSAKEETESKKDSKEEKIAELTETLQRLQAEFENYKKQIDKERAHVMQYASADFIAKLLPIIDSFELALKTEKDGQEFVKGVELIYVELEKLLKQEGVTPIATENQKFDPALHEVMMKASSEKEDGAIIEELQKGYLFKDKVLRHSKVKVSEGKKSNS